MKNITVTLTRPYPCPDFDLLEGDTIQIIELIDNTFLRVKVLDSQEKSIIGEITDIDITEIL